MADQPRYEAYEESALFANGSSSRPLPPGTISVDASRDRLLTTGLTEGEPATTFPFAITMEVVERGRQRYEIFCVPCHDLLGTGHGMAIRRGFRTTPPSFNAEDLRAAPPGYFFNVITNGHGAMPSYAGQTAVRDRWAITAYVRALQLAMQATPEDVPPDVLRDLEANRK